MREKVAADLEFRQRLLDYIAQAISETLPEDIESNENFEHDVDNRIGRRVFQPFIAPDAPNFDEEIKLDLTDILRTRQMHSPTHMPTCFKYGSKRCRSHFPRRIIVETQFDAENRVFYIKRNHRWLNNHNKWIAVMTRANHDCRFLFTKNHASGRPITDGHLRRERDWKEPSHRGRQVLVSIVKSTTRTRRCLPRVGFYPRKFAICDRRFAPPHFTFKLNSYRVINELDPPSLGSRNEG
jgi:hypothetical protein